VSPDGIDTGFGRQQAARGVHFLNAKVRHDPDAGSLKCRRSELVRGHRPASLGAAAKYDFSSAIIGRLRVPWLPDTE